MIGLSESYPALPIAAAIMVFVVGFVVLFAFATVCFDLYRCANGLANRMAQPAKSDFWGARSITAVLGVCRSQEFFDQPDHRKGIGLGHNRANAHFMSVALQVGASMLGE